MNRIQKEKTAQQVKQDRVKNYASLSKKLRSQFSDVELIEALAMLEVSSHGLAGRAVVYAGQWNDGEYVPMQRKIRKFLGVNLDELKKTEKSVGVYNGKVSGRCPNP